MKIVMMILMILPRLTTAGLKKTLVTKNTTPDDFFFSAASLYRNVFNSLHTAWRHTEVTPPSANCDALSYVDAQLSWDDIIQCLYATVIFSRCGRRGSRTDLCSYASSRQLLDALLLRFSVELILNLFQHGQGEVEIWRLTSAKCTAVVSSVSIPWMIWCLNISASPITSIILRRA